MLELLRLECDLAGHGVNRVMKALDEMVEAERSANVAQRTAVATLNTKRR